MMFPENRELPNSFYRLRRETVYLNGTSADITPSGTTYIVLYWKADSRAVGYNLYRRRRNEKYERPINGSHVIKMVQTCTQLQAVIPSGSKEWVMLENAFTGVSGYRTYKKAAGNVHLLAVLLPNLHLDERGLSNIERLDANILDQMRMKMDPCSVLQRGLTKAEEEVLDLLATANLKIRLVRGLAFVDKKVVARQEYFYELRGVQENGREITLDSDFCITAGSYQLPSPPGAFSADSGDSKVLALWNDNRYAFTYILQRAVHQPIQVFQTVNEEPIFLEITDNLDGKQLVDPRPGFLDFQRWDDDGLPTTHDVNGVAVAGPTNGQIYDYRVASQDILGRTGTWSGVCQAAPAWKTPPMAPDQLQVNPSAVPLGLALDWKKVTRDVDNHQILDVSQTYHIYRGESQSELDDLAGLSALEVGTKTANPTSPASETLSWTDTDPSLVQLYGEKDFWYRLRCEDMHGNLSAPSATLSGRIPDITPPGPTKVTHAEGFADHITVFWNPNSEPDLAGYQVYRGLCDKGKLYVPPKREEYRSCDMMLVGQLSLKEAQERLEATGEVYFEDSSLPGGSPLCYAYWVRAYDQSQNLYQGNHGCPASEDEYVCQRLYEETPPPAPIITALKARNNAVLIEWIASPIQDLHAFHVYRSTSEYGPVTFIGCVFTDGSNQADRWKGIDHCACAEIPAETSPTTIQVSFEDTKVDPQVVYWYRVSALDWLANESEAADITNLPAISTFTYSKDLPQTPTVNPQSVFPLEGCGLVVTWLPAYDSMNGIGYVVFRSLTLLGNYHQVSPIITGNEFTDRSALRGTEYWYRVQAVGSDGKHSQPSAPVRYQY